jgi:hypothetical protein
MAYTDIYVKLHEDREFARKIARSFAEIQRLEEDDAASTVLADLVTDVYKQCGFNAGLLLPYFFPDFLGGAPLSLMQRPFAFCMYMLAVNMSLTLRGSRQISKSTNLCARQLIHSEMLGGYSSLYVAPHTDHLKTYANRMSEMQRAFRFYDPSSKLRNNLTYKEFINGSKLEMIRVLTSASPARGKSTDEVLFDEYQQFDPDLEMEVLQTWKASKIKAAIYAGTSLTVDTPLETKYQESSQGVWMIRCPTHFGKWINCGKPDEILPTFRINGLFCPCCSKRLDVTQGEMVHTFNDLVLRNRVGFHIPQIAVPEFANDPVQYADIFNQLQQYGTKKFLQEVLGIPTEEGIREITLVDLKKMCCLPDSEQTLKEKAASGKYYKYVVSGCDWGGSDYNIVDRTKVSYTLHSMLGVHFDGKIDIIHMRQYAGMDYREIINCIAKDHKKYGGSFIASDFGGGQGYNMLIREHPDVDAEKHFMFFYSAPMTAPISLPKESQAANMFTLNKTESITQLYHAIKEDPPRIRCFNWDSAEHLLSEFLNVYRIPTEREYGPSVFRYRRHGAKPDDTLHSINYAFNLVKLILGEPVIEDKAMQLRVMEMIHRPGRFVGSILPGRYPGGGAISG